MAAWIILAIGAVCAALYPIFFPAGFDAKTVLFYVLIALFLEVVLAYPCLAYAKYRNAKLAHLLARKIVSWEAERPEKKPSYLIGFIPVAVIIAMRFILNANAMDHFASLLLCAAVSFTILGWLELANKRIADAEKNAPSFVLAHDGLVYNGRAESFNGITKGIAKAEEADGVLHLTVLRGKKTQEISLPIPEEEKQAVADFLADMKEHFDAEG